MRPKEKPRKTAAAEPPRKEEQAYYGAVERAGLRFFDAPPAEADDAPQPEKEGDNER